MTRILFAFAFLTHPVFIPIYSILIYNHIIRTYATGQLVLVGIWLVFSYLLLPLLYFKRVRSYDLVQPTMEERRSIYKAYLLLSVAFIPVSHFVIPEYRLFFTGLAAMHGFMYLLTLIDLKASWHTAAWGFLLMTGLHFWYTYQMTDFMHIVVVLTILTILVFICRGLQKAHSLFELTMGLATGVVASIILLLS